jgi:hypothetical protein
MIEADHPIVREMSEVLPDKAAAPTGLGSPTSSRRAQNQAIAGTERLSAPPVRRFA